jgi:hypothetical protein
VRARCAALAVFLCGAVGGACGSTSKVCQPFDVQQLDEAAGCLGPPVPATGLSICHDPAVAQAKGIRPACFVDESGSVFRGWFTSTEWFEPSSFSGWTHSDLLTAPSTLSVADEARCAPVFAPTGPACP